MEFIIQSKHFDQSFFFRRIHNFLRRNISFELFLIFPQFFLIQTVSIHPDHIWFYHASHFKHRTDIIHIHIRDANSLFRHDHQKMFLFQPAQSVSNRRPAISRILKQ